MQRRRRAGNSHGSPRMFARPIASRRPNAAIRAVNLEMRWEHRPINGPRAQKVAAAHDRRPMLGAFQTIIMKSLHSQSATMNRLIASLGILLLASTATAAAADMVLDCHQFVKKDGKTWLPNPVATVRVGKSVSMTFDKPISRSSPVIDGRSMVEILDEKCGARTGHGANPPRPR